MPKYNGVELPALPEWDVETYPYAMIVRVAGIYTLQVCSKPFCKGDTMIQSTAPFYHCTWDYSDGEWVAGVTDAHASSAGYPTANFIWTNTPIKDSADNVYMDASDPVYEKWKGLKSWLAGLIANLPVPVPLHQGKEPVAYLYNGVRLPKLPEWDKESFPFAFITKYETNGVYVLYVSDYAVYCGATENDDLVCLAKANCLSWVCTDGVWEHASDGYLLIEKDGKYVWNLTPATASIWTNTNICYADGTVYLAASEPVPVYE